MMKKLFFPILIICTVCMADHPGMANSLTDQADALFKQDSMESYVEAIKIYEKVLSSSPNDFETLRKCAQACQTYGDLAYSKKIKGWKKICETYGKKGMTYSKRCITLKPERVEGHYFLGCNTGTYSDGAGIFAIVKEGIINKIKTSLEKAYEIDKKYDNGGPMQALGRFYFLLPWPMKDIDKSIAYLRESMEMFPRDIAGKVFLAESLLKSNDKKDREEAIKLLVSASDVSNASSENSPAARKKYSGMAKNLLQNHQL